MRLANTSFESEADDGEGSIMSQSTATSSYVAFLRAINVGGRTVRMAELRAIIEELGFSNVETFIASGNVIVETTRTDTRSLEAQIERHLASALGYEVDTFVRSTDELTRIARCQPFPASPDVTEGGALHVAFLHSAPSDDAIDALMAYRTQIDDFHVNGREVYWRCTRKISESTFSGTRLEKALGMPSTMRNWNTVHRITGRYCEPASSS